MHFVLYGTLGAASACIIPGMVQGRLSFRPGPTTTGSAAGERKAKEGVKSLLTKYEMLSESVWG